MKEATVWLSDIGSEVYLGSSHLLIYKGPCASMWPCLCGFLLCSMIIHEMFVTIKVAKEFNTNG